MAASDTRPGGEYGFHRVQGWMRGYPERTGAEVTACSYRVDELQVRRIIASSWHQAVQHQAEGAQHENINARRDAQP